VRGGRCGSGLIIGSRDFLLLELIAALAPDIVVVSDGALGVDIFPVTPEEWRLYGKPAGPRRSERMTRTVQGVAAFWTGQVKRSGIYKAFTFALGLGLPVRLTFPGGRVEFPSASPR
jgi:hypothetical protein